MDSVIPSGFSDLHFRRNFWLPATNPPDLSRSMLHRTVCSPPDPPVPPDPKKPSISRSDLRLLQLSLSSHRLLRISDNVVAHLTDGVVYRLRWCHRRTHLTDEEHNDSFTTLLFHRGNGFTYVKWLHLPSLSPDLSSNPPSRLDSHHSLNKIFSYAAVHDWIGHATLIFRPLTGFLPVRCRALPSRGSYEVKAVKPFLLPGPYHIWTWPNKIFGWFYPKRSSFDSPFLPSMLIHLVDALISILTRLFSLVCIRMTQIFPTSSLLAKVVVDSKVVPRY